MNVTLPPEFEVMVQEKVATGRYGDAGEVVREALRQMAERDRQLDRLRAAVAIADEQFARGQSVEWSQELSDRIMAEAREAARAGKQPKPDVVP